MARRSSTASVLSAAANGGKGTEVTFKVAMTSQAAYLSVGCKSWTKEFVVEVCDELRRRPDGTFEVKVTIVKSERTWLFKRKARTAITWHWDEMAGYIYDASVEVVEVETRSVHPGIYWSESQHRWYSLTPAGSLKLLGDVANGEPQAVKRVPEDVSVRILFRDPTSNKDEHKLFDPYDIEVF